MKRLFKVGSNRHDVGRVTFSWHPEGNFLASAGKNGIVQITDRFGETIEEIPMKMNAAILTLAWDKDGEYLAILQDTNSIITLWHLGKRQITELDTTFKDPTFMSWSVTGPQLAVGTAKGNLLIYNKSNKKKIPLVGKHSKQILCGAWSAVSNRLALGSDDKHFTVSNDVGETLLHAELRNVPHQLLFTYRRTMNDTSNNNEQNTVSAIMDGKSVLLHNVSDEGEDSMELTFAQNKNGTGCKYGDIVHHLWMDENMLLVGFSGGTILLVSTGHKDLGEEKCSVKFHPNNLITFAYNPVLKRCASAGDDGLRVFDVRDFKESEQDFIHRRDLEDGRVSEIAWSPDGQILTVGTNSGNIYNFLAKVTVLSTVWKSSVAYLSSLRDVSVIDAAETKRGRRDNIVLRLEPSIIALGPQHLAACMNNRVYYHRITASTAVIEKEYASTVREIQLNGLYAAVLIDSKALVHAIDPSSPDINKQSVDIITFPSRDEGSYSRVTCIAMTVDFFFYGTQAGTVEVFYMDEWVLLSGSELRLNNSIKKLYPNSAGTRVVVVDGANQVFLYNPVYGGGVNQNIIQFDLVPSNIVSVLWDLSDQHIIMIFDGKYIHTYVYVQSSAKGPLLTKLGPMEVSTYGEIELRPDKIEVAAGNVPLLSLAGTFTCQTVAGAISSIVHPYFDHLDEDELNSANGTSTKKPAYDTSLDRKALTYKFCQSLALSKLHIAWSVALLLDKRQYYLALSGKAMELLDIELACKVYRQLGDAGKVLALQELLLIEDKLLLSGHVALLFDNYNLAQELFLTSSQPSAALDMRRDLLQWDQALKIAEALSLNSQMPEICVKYGQQLEFRNDAEMALRMFELALNTTDHTGRNLCNDQFASLAMMGISRCQLKLGNIRQGMRLALDVNDQELYNECGDILEQQKQYSEAANFYEKAKKFDKVALMYTKYLIKNDKNRINEAAIIMAQVSNDQLNSAFAKLCVTAGRYDEAAKAYARANDTDKVVELKLRYLEQVQDAFDLVRSSASAQGAQVIADYCIEIQDFRAAIEFLLIANKTDEAFKLSQEKALMESFTTMLGEQISNDDALKVAHYYEKLQDFGNAGKFYSYCGQYSRALKLFIQCGDRRIDDAIAVVGKSQSEALVHTLIDFLVGEKDGVPKDPNYIYRLHMALHRYEDASKTALIIARQEQDLGNYSLAHSVIVETIRSLEDANIKVSLQIRQMFILLHSYMLVKIQVKHGNHLGAARLLLRVSQSISKFPQHIVQILTSTVIECQRGGLKASAYENAVLLMRPEYRQNIEVSIRRKFEAIVRKKSSQVDEIDEDRSEDPISNELLPEYQLESPVTRDAIPMCIITGRHLVKSDWTFCPNSKFPALYSEYVKYIEKEKQFAISGAIIAAGDSDVPPASSSPTGALDPVLGKPIDLGDLKLATTEEAANYIKKYNNVLEDKKKRNAASSSDGLDGEDGGNLGEEDGSNSSVLDESSGLIRYEEFADDKYVGNKENKKKITTKRRGDVDDGDDSGPRPSAGKLKTASGEDDFGNSLTTNSGGNLPEKSSKRKDRGKRIRDFDQ